MRALITDDMVRTYGIVGTPEQCAEAIYERFGARASDVCCYFPGYSPTGDDVGDLIAAVQRLPALRG
jgi:alkanesulfonate monooxygenase SsuD/methylene tetrahydromethanopterin reductase-like flavin-dependent oxidoreductase (luciferase family)